MSTPPDADQPIARQVQDLLTRKRPWLLATARGMCRNEVDAEDLVQEACLRYLKHMEQASAVPPEAVCNRWLVSTLTHCFLGQLRRQRTHERRATDPTLAERLAPSPEEGSDGRMHEIISSEELRAAIESLSPRSRATLELQAKGLRYQEIAQALSIPAGTVAKRLHDARKKLRDLLGRPSGLAKGGH